MQSPSGQVLANEIDIYQPLPRQDRDGGPQYPDTPSQSQVPCSIQQREVDEEIDDQGRVTRVQYYHIFFGAVDPGVQSRAKLQYTDTLGATRILFARATRDEGGRGAIFVVRAIEKL